MKKFFFRAMTVMAAVLFLSVTMMDSLAHARAGGGRSYGSRGMRSYARPTNPYNMQSPPRPPMSPAPNVYRPQQSGGFFKSMAGGMMGGLVVGMLFRSLGFAGPGGGTGGGIGLFELLLLAGGGYLVYRFVRNKRGT